ncbi:MAG: hypothetical protein JXA42_22195 [Anaerolineales bacterium]|nr:hypothetical protein [Anaerolineales bacterium]
MPIFTQTQAKCAVCQQPFTAQIEQIIDVGLEPTSKERLLSGQINIVQCPKCGNGGRIITPLLYHDPDNELLLVYVPVEMNISQVEREQLIGSLTRTLMAKIPAEARKGYLFSPQNMLTMESLIERVLEIEGISPEVLETQRVKSELLLRLMEASDSEFEALVKARDADIDETFFQILDSLVQSAKQSNRQKESSDFLRLRNRLLPLVSWSRERGITPKMLDDQQARMELIEKFLETKDDDWPSVAKENDREIDYLFFQLLTAIAESAPKVISERLISLRTVLLESSSTGKGVAERQKAVDGLKAAAERDGGLTREALLKQILWADGDSAIEALAMAANSLLDYSFFLLMADEIDAAKKRGDKKEADRISTIREKLVDLTVELEKLQEERIKRSIQQIEELLKADDKEKAVDRLLSKVDDFFLSILASQIEQAKRAGDEREKELQELIALIIRRIQANAPPEIQLVNKLVEIDDPDSLDQAIRDHHDEITPDVIKAMEAMQEGLESAGQQELLKRLTTIIELAKKVIE